MRKQQTDRSRCRWAMNLHRQALCARPRVQAGRRWREEPELFDVLAGILLAAAVLPVAVDERHLRPGVEIASAGNRLENEVCRVPVAASVEKHDNERSTLRRGTNLAGSQLARQVLQETERQIAAGSSGGLVTVLEYRLGCAQQMCAEERLERLMTHLFEDLVQEALRPEPRGKLVMGVTDGGAAWSKKPRWSESTIKCHSLRRRRCLTHAVSS